MCNFWPRLSAGQPDLQNDLDCKPPAFEVPALGEWMRTDWTSADTHQLQSFDVELADNGIIIDTMDRIEFDHDIITSTTQHLCWEQICDAKAKAEGEAETRGNLFFQSRVCTAEAPSAMQLESLDLAVPAQYDGWDGVLDAYQAKGVSFG